MLYRSARCKIQLLTSNIQAFLRVAKKIHNDTGMKLGQDNVAFAHLVGSELATFKR